MSSTAEVRSAQEKLLIPLISSSDASSSSESSEGSNPNLLDKIGLNNTILFQPADIEMKENFTIVAEWRNFNKTRISRHQDIALNKVYKWMGKKEYRLQTSLQSFFTHNTLSEEEKSVIFGKVDSNNQLALEELFGPLVQLYEVTGRLQKYMEVAEEKRLVEFKFPMTVLELSDGYDYLRETDYQIYLAYMVWKDQHDGLDAKNQPKLKKAAVQQPNKPIFHFLFRPDITKIVQP